MDPELRVQVETQVRKNNLGSVQAGVLYSKDHVWATSGPIVTINTPLQMFLRRESINRENLHAKASQLPKLFAQTQGKLCSEHNKTKCGRCWPEEKLQSCYFLCCVSKQLASSSFIHRALSHAVSSCHAELKTMKRSPALRGQQESPIDPGTSTVALPNFKRPELFYFSMDFQTQSVYL